ncbi:MAG TPA: hypothetical protein VHL51_10860 [Gaiellales bacterium]|nr:hypothetical protein [Gaiellales bacterium]
MMLTRKQLLAGAGATTLAAAGLYELAERVGRAPARPAAGPHEPEQHLLQGLRVVVDNNVDVVVPPLHHELVTFRLAAQGRSQLRDAQHELEGALSGLDGEFQATPAGLGVTVGWGLPYFRQHVPGPSRTHLPVDRRASQAAGHPVAVLLDAIRFPSDPPGVVLEGHDAAVLLRSDVPANLRTAHQRLVGLSMWRPTTIRRGFVGGGFDGGRALPRTLAEAAGVPGAELIPEQAELFLGFTSTQRAALGPGRIANVETLGYSDGGPGGYFRRGTVMSVSHIFEDLESWFLTFDHGQRAATVFGPGRDVQPGTLTVPEGPGDVGTVRGIVNDARSTSRVGHSPAIQTTSRLQADAVGPDGTRYAKGTAVPQRADFNTLDNPFAWSADPQRDRMQPDPAAGLHFVVFNPTSDDFHRNRLAMDGILPGGVRTPLAPRDPGQGFNSVLTTTHRQAFLVPPRAHRALPLAELL